MNLRSSRNSYLSRAGAALAALLFAGALALAAGQGPAQYGQNDPGRSVLVLTSTNGPGSNDVVVFKLDTAAAPSLSLVNTLPTGGKGGAGTNAGSLQFSGDLGAVANFGSDSVSQLVREGDFIAIGKTIKLRSGCVNPDSVALANQHLFVVGTNCAESHWWPEGILDGAVALSDPSAAQIAVGKSWSAVTLTSGSVLQLPLTADGALSGASATVTLPLNANTVPLGEAFWQDVLGFTPAHSPDSFAIVNKGRTVFPVVGPTPAYPTNAPCWVAKGAGNIWYTGNSPGEAISIFFSDSQGGIFYKSVPLPGSPSDITVSADGKWLAVIYVAGSQGHVAVFAIDSYGDLTPVATSSSIGVAGFNGVAISE